jgi:mRNA interferase MazF
MTLHKGDIVLLPFPFTDLRTTKVRPAVVLWVDITGYDVTSCFISSQNVTTLSPKEFLLDPSDSDFEITGLRVASKVRVTRIVTIEQDS